MSFRLYVPICLLLVVQVGLVAAALGVTATHLTELRPLAQALSRNVTIHSAISSCDDWRLAKTGSVCRSCIAVMSTMEKLSYNNATVENVQVFLKDICVSLHIEQQVVCSGTIQAFAPVLISLLQRLYSPTIICQNLFFCPPDTQDARCEQDWKRKVQEAPVVSRSKSPLIPDTQPTNFLFVQISDIHIDPLYKVGSDAACGRPVCCQDGDGDAGEFGSFGCDSPPRLVQSLLQFVSNMTPKPDFILWTGDQSPHDVWQQSPQYQLDHINITTTMMRLVFPDIPIIPTIGNHAGFPLDQFPLPPDLYALTGPVAALWSPWLPADAQLTFAYGGYYTLLLKSGLRILALNLMYCDPLNLYVRFSDISDPAGQLAWMEAVLAQARDANERVFLIAHIPAGIDGADPVYSCVDPYNTRYRLIIAAYSDVISAQFTGHTHTDGFRLFSDIDNDDIPVNVAFISPSVTPYVGGGGVNPSVRLYSYDTLYNINDYTEYYLDLIAANSLGIDAWKKLYSLREAYNMMNASALEFKKLATDMWKHSSVYNTFWRNKYTGATPPSCDILCKLTHVCASEHVDCEGYKRCINHFHHDGLNLLKLQRSSRLASELSTWRAGEGSSRGIMALLHLLFDQLCE